MGLYLKRMKRHCWIIREWCQLESKGVFRQVEPHWTSLRPHFKKYHLVVKCGEIRLNVVIKLKNFLHHILPHSATLSQVAPL